MNSKDKDNFAQAMKELLNSGTGAAPEEKKDNTVALSFGEGEKPEKAADKPAAPATSAPVTTPSPSFTAESAPVFVAEPKAPSSEVTVIAPGTKIVGDIEADGGLQVGGSVKGNLKVAATLDLNGRIIGDIEAEDISVITSVVKGNVTARNMMRIDKDTTVVGDLMARNAEIDGKIKGNVTVTERAHIKADSILVGNLVSGTVNVEEGAMLKGDISIVSAQKDDLKVDDLEFDINID